MRFKQSHKDYYVNSCVVTRWEQKSSPLPQHIAAQESSLANGARSSLRYRQSDQTASPSCGSVQTARYRSRRAPPPRCAAARARADGSSAAPSHCGSAPFQSNHGREQSRQGNCVKGEGTRRTKGIESGRLLWWGEKHPRIEKSIILTSRPSIAQFRRSSERRALEQYPHP